MNCITCNGLGWVVVRSRDDAGNRVETDEDCSECEGSGEADE